MSFSGAAIGALGGSLERPKKEEERLPRPDNSVQVARARTAGSFLPAHASLDADHGWRLRRLRPPEHVLEARFRRSDLPRRVRLRDDERMGAGAPGQNLRFQRLTRCGRCGTPSPRARSAELRG